MVYLREETSVHNKVGAMRDLDPSPDEFVAVKWHFKWTGPHMILRALLGTCTSLQA